MILDEFCYQVALTVPRVREDAINVLRDYVLRGARRMEYERLADIGRNASKLADLDQTLADLDTPQAKVCLLSDVMDHLVHSREAVEHLNTTVPVPVLLQLDRVVRAQIVSPTDELFFARIGALKLENEELAVAWLRGFKDVSYAKLRSIFLRFLKNAGHNPVAGNFSLIRFETRRKNGSLTLMLKTKVRGKSMKDSVPFWTGYCPSSP